MRRSALAIVLAAVVSANASAEQSPELRVTMRDLGMFGDSDTFATAINNRGDVVGYSESGTFLWTRSDGFRQLPFGGIPTDINERRQIVGFALECSDDQCREVGFVWSAREGLRTLGSFLPAEINDKGDIAGKCLLSDSSTTPCVYIGGVLRFVKKKFIGEATGINARGDVVGWMYVRAEAHPRGFVRTRKGQLRLLPPIPRDPTTDGTMAFDINDAGTIAGALFDHTGHYAAVWRRGLPILIDFGGGGGGSGTTAFDINNRGLVRGWMFPGDDPYAPPIVWDWKTGSVALLPDNDLEAYAQDINDRGQIVGSVMTPDSGFHAVVWQVRQ